MGSGKVKVRDGKIAGERERGEQGEQRKRKRGKGRHGMEEEDMEGKGEVRW